MKKQFPAVAALLLLPVFVVVLSSFYQKLQWQKVPSFPYQQMGLTKRQAAAHLLSRFSFGATPGQIDKAEAMGLERWFAEQLTLKSEGEKVANALSGLESLTMSNEEIVRVYPRAGQVLKMAIRDGVIANDDAKAADKETRDVLKDYMQKKGIKPQSELLRQLMQQKIVRAAYAENQLQQVLTDFWFNHFNVAVSKGGVQQFVTTYERDAIRPNVLGRFETMLLATAKSPAMLTYLDNTKSSVNEENEDDMQKKMARQREKLVGQIQDRIKDSAQQAALRKIKKPKMQGLNENYAREIMELHTLGVDGGYTQTDVTQAARVLTGWSLNPEIEYGVKIKHRPNQGRLEKMGFVYDDNFLFAANKHDRGEKKVLGVLFPAGGGYEEGLKLIHLLATHPSTAKFISKKLATRFVSDAPPQSLVDKMTSTFLATEGDLKEVLIAMVSAPEFWSANALREKTKSPLELVMSAVRGTNANIVAPYQLYQWMVRMGQKLYNYQAPTGFPDRGQYWINTGSLLNRMNFGLALASNRIQGVKVNLPALNNNHEPESAEDALKKYAQLLMPERDISETIKRLRPMLTDPELQEKIKSAASTSSPATAEVLEEDDSLMVRKTNKKSIGKKNSAAQIEYAPGNNAMLGQVVGIIIGSPEYQRR